MTPITIQHEPPPPRYKSELRMALLSLGPDECICWHGSLSSWKHVYLYAKKHGLVVRTQKQPDGSIKIWRICN